MNITDVESTDIANGISCAVESFYMPIFRDGKDLRDIYVVKSLEETPNCTQEQDGIDMTSFAPSSGFNRS